MHICNATAKWPHYKNVYPITQSRKIRVCQDKKRKEKKKNCLLAEGMRTQGTGEKIAMGIPWYTIRKQQKTLGQPAPLRG